MRKDTTHSGSRISKIPVERLRPIDAAAALDSETIVIDLCEEVDQVGTRIPGSIPVNLEILTPWATGKPPEIAKGWGPDRRIIVYSSDDATARAGAECLCELGFERAGYLIGGLEEWNRRETQTSLSTEDATTDTRREQ